MISTDDSIPVLSLQTVVGGRDASGGDRILSDPSAHVVQPEERGNAACATGYKQYTWLRRDKAGFASQDYLCVPPEVQ